MTVTQITSIIKITQRKKFKKKKNDTTYLLYVLIMKKIHKGK